MKTEELWRLLNRETLEVLYKKGIDFSGYNTIIPNYIILIIEYKNDKLKELGYEELTNEERETYGLNKIKKYKKKVLYKIPIEKLKERHS